MNVQPISLEDSSRLQEAIDTIVQEFDHPTRVSIKYSLNDGTKQTIFTVETVDGDITYELVYDGRHDEVEPELTYLE